MAPTYIPQVGFKATRLACAAHTLHYEVLNELSYIPHTIWYVPTYQKIYHRFYVPLSAIPTSPYTILHKHLHLLHPHFYPLHHVTSALGDHF